MVIYQTIEELSRR